MNIPELLQQYEKEMPAVTHDFHQLKKLYSYNPASDLIKEALGIAQAAYYTTKCRIAFLKFKMAHA